jgi:hypothetical protein
MLQLGMPQSETVHGKRAEAVWALAKMAGQPDRLEAALSHLLHATMQSQHPLK